jgi:selenocysteine lyase/cysteine desulfurase
MTVFGASTTQLFRNVSCALHFDAGDEIVVSSIDHEANIAPWVDLAERQGLTVKWWTPTREDVRLRAEDVVGLLSERTRLVTCTHASNILGTIHDVRAIADVVHNTAPRALVCVDGVAFAPHRPIDVKALGVDLYAFSWYKVYGPHVSMLYASPAANQAIRSLGHFFNRHVTLENKIGLAAASYELTQAVVSVVDYLGLPEPRSAKWTAVAEQEQLLQTTLLEWLVSRSGVTVLGETSSDPSLRVPTISFVVDGWSSQDLVEAVEKDTNFGFRWGSFYSNRLVQEHLGRGEDGVVRVSMVHYNTGMF